MGEPIFLFGAGGHGRSVFEVAVRQGSFDVVAVLDDTAREFRGIGVAGGREHLATLAAQGLRRGVIAIGDNAVRRQLTELVDHAGLSLVSLVDPAAVVARDVPLGDGTVVMPGAVVNVGTSVGRNVILNTACTVDHDGRIDDFAHLSPGVHVSGECVVGEGAHIGIGASILQQIHVGAGATVGAGAAVTKDVAPGAVVVGVPARELGR